MKVKQLIKMWVKKTYGLSIGVAGVLLLLQLVFTMLAQPNDFWVSTLLIVADIFVIFGYVGKVSLAFFHEASYYNVCRKTIFYSLMGYFCIFISLQLLIGVVFGWINEIRGLTIFNYALIHFIIILMSLCLNFLEFFSETSNGANYYDFGIVIAIIIATGETRNFVFLNLFLNQKMRVTWWGILLDIIVIIGLLLLTRYFVVSYTYDKGIIKSN